MLAKLSVDQALMKARSHIKKDEITEAKKLYQSVLIVFPNNLRAQKGLAALKNYKQDNAIQAPPSETVKQLANLYKMDNFKLWLSKHNYLRFNIHKHL